MSTLNCNIEKHANDLLIMSFNIQSINSKFDEVSTLIQTLTKKNISPDIICLQELWQFPPNANFAIPGYHKLVYKLRSENVKGGGVGLFIKNNLGYSINKANSIFVNHYTNHCLLKLLILEVKKF